MIKFHLDLSLSLKPLGGNAGYETAAMLMSKVCFLPRVGRLMAGSVRTKLDSMASKLSANIVATKKRSAINPKCRFDLPIGQLVVYGRRYIRVKAFIFLPRVTFFSFFIIRTTISMSRRKKNTGFLSHRRKRYDSVALLKMEGPRMIWSK